MLKTAAKKYTVFALFFVAVTTFALWLSIFVSESEVAQELVAKYGYLGIFVMGTVSGFNLAFPVPAVAFVPVFTASGLSAVPAVILMALGMTLGDLAGYFIGRAGHEVLLKNHNSDNGILGKFREKLRRAPLLLLFLYIAFVPFPNEILVIPMGFIGYRLKHIFPVILAGNMIFNTLASLAFLGIFQQIM